MQIWVSPLGPQVGIFWSGLIVKWQLLNIHSASSEAHHCLLLGTLSGYTSCMCLPLYLSCSSHSPIYRLTVQWEQKNYHLHLGIVQAAEPWNPVSSCASDALTMCVHHYCRISGCQLHITSPSLALVHNMSNGNSRELAQARPKYLRKGNWGWSICSMSRSLNWQVQLHYHICTVHEPCCKCNLLNLSLEKADSKWPGSWR